MGLPRGGTVLLRQELLKRKNRSSRTAADLAQDLGLASLAHVLSPSLSIDGLDVRLTDYCDGPSSTRITPRRGHQVRPIFLGGL